MLKIIITRAVFILLFTVKFTFQDEHDDLIQVISNFFTQRHVQTITAATCWPSSM